MSLEQTIRDKLIAESMDLDARLQQLVRAGLMPANTLPLLRKAVAKVQGGMSLQGPERDVMATFINSMMYIVLGDDTIFNKARAGAKGYATEETDLEEAAVSKNQGYGYHGNVEASSDEERAKKFSAMHSRVKKLVAPHLQDAKKPNVMVRHFLDSAQGRHIAHNPDDKEISSRFKQFKKVYKPEMHEEVEQLDELSPKTLGNYVKKAAGHAAGSAAASAAIASSSNPKVPAKVKRDLRNRMTGISKATDRLTKEEVEELDELSRATVGRYAQKAKSIADNEGGKDRTKGRELAGRKRWGGTMSGVKKAKVMATEGRRAEALVDIASVKQMNESYKTTFNAALEQYGIKSPSELDEEKRKEFFNFVDQNYKKGDN